MILCALRDGSGWRKVNVESAAIERVPLYIAPDKEPRMVRTEVVGKKLLGLLRPRMRSVGWRLLREEGAISAGYQQVFRVVLESSTCVRFEFSQKALDEQKKLERKDLLAAWAAVGSCPVELLVEWRRWARPSSAACGGTQGPCSIPTRRCAGSRWNSCGGGPPC